jgi:hypothetical protein
VSITIDDVRHRQGRTIGEIAMERKLTTILAADVVGYSALMERDEAGTHERLKAGRKENEKIALAKADADLTEYDYYILGHVHSLKDKDEPARAVWEKGLNQIS